MNCSPGYSASVALVAWPFSLKAPRQEFIGRDGASESLAPIEAETFCAWCSGQLKDEDAMAMMLIQIPPLQLHIISELLQFSPGDMRRVLGSEIQPFSPRPKGIFNTLHDSLILLFLCPSLPYAIPRFNALVRLESLILGDRSVRAWRVVPGHHLRPSHVTWLCAPFYTDQINPDP